MTGDVFKSSVCACRRSVADVVDVVVVTGVVAVKIASFWSLLSVATVSEVVSLFEEVSPVKSLVLPENEADFLWHSFSLPLTAPLELAPCTLSPSALLFPLVSACGRLVVELLRLWDFLWGWWAFACCCCGGWRKTIFSPFSLIAKLLVLDPERKSITPWSSSKDAIEGDWSFEPVIFLYF